MTFKGTLRPFQVEAFERMVERKRMLVAYEMGLGKSQPVTTPVLTPEGWVAIGMLEVGDEVIGSNGVPTVVGGVFPQGLRPMVRVTFSDESWVDCDPDHLWEVNTPLRRNRGNPPRVLKAREIAERLVDGAGNRQHFIPLVEPVQWEPVAVPLDPYLMGALLGDGSFAVARRVRFSTADEEMRVEVERLLPAGMVLKYEGGYDYSLIGTAWHANPVLMVIRELGMEGHRSETKQVPRAYLYGSVEQRLSLLQGLLDTDGHVRPKDNNVEFCTVSERLALDVQHVVQSLGGTAPIRQKVTSHQLAYRMSIALPRGLNPFRLSRKANAYRERGKYPPSRSVVSVVDIAPAEAVCIMVDAPDHLYVTKDFLVTHNTVLTIAAVEHLLDQGEVASGLIVVPASLKYQWRKEIEKFTTDATVVVVDGTKTQREKAYIEVMGGGVEYTILNYEALVNDWDLVRFLPRDYVVLDEATAIKNPSALRTRRTKKLGAPYRFALSGQPIENRPEEIFSIMQWVDKTVLGDPEIFERSFIVRDSFGRVKFYKNLPTLHRAVSAAMVRKTRHDPDVAPFMPKVVEEVVTVNFDPEGARLYRYIVKDLLTELAKITQGSGFSIEALYYGGDQASEAQGRIMSKLTCLRMLCDHPELLRRSAALYDGTYVEGESIQAGSAYASELQAMGKLDTLKAKPKLKETVALIEELLDADSGNQIVLFSFFKESLRHVQEATKHLTQSVIFDGDMNAKQKDIAKTKFQTDPKVRLFLSSDAGGYGVDLPNANYLISFDLPWSAGKLDQRNARIIRLSSEFESVTLLNVLMRGSIEERQFDLLEQKRAIASAIVDGRGIDGKGRLNLDLKTLTEFLATTAV